MSIKSVIALVVVGCVSVLVSSSPNYQQNVQQEPQQPYRHPQLPPQQQYGDQAPPIVHYPVPARGPPAASTGNQPIINRPFPDGEAPPLNSILIDEISEDCEDEDTGLVHGTPNMSNPLNTSTLNPLNITNGNSSTTTESSSTTDGSSTSGSSTTEPSSTTTDGSTTPGASTLLPTLATLPTLLPTIPTVSPITLLPTTTSAPSTTSGLVRRRRASDEQKMKMEKVMKLVDMIKLQDCVARVICALNCAPDAYGADGKKVFQMMLQVQSSGTVNETETKYYVTAAMNGRRNREGNDCNKCNAVYCNCEATSQDLIDVVSLVNLDDN